jgi:predicted nucleic-acid-binding protein
MIALDTNVLARYFVVSSDEPSQKQSAAAKKLLESGKSLFVSKSVVLELLIDIMKPLAMRSPHPLLRKLS